MAGLDSLEEFIVTIIWYVVCFSSIVANTCAIFVLRKKIPKLVPDMLVLHLVISELGLVIWNVTLRSMTWFGDIPRIPMVRMIGSQFGTSLIYQLIIIISLDRFLVAKLNVRYRVMVTKRKLFWVVILIWVLSIISAVICGIYSHFKTVVWIFWSVITIVSIVASYSYIILVLHRQKKTLKSSRSNVGQFKYKVPLCIAFSTILIMLIPDIIAVVDPKLISYNLLLVIWYTNFLIHPLLYVFSRVCYKRHSQRQTSECGKHTMVAEITTTV